MPGDIVIYESTVYPGATGIVCCPVLERYSGSPTQIYACGQSAYLGYSPERINPGDKAHRVSDIVKVTSGSTPEIALSSMIFTPALLPLAHFVPKVFALPGRKGH